MNNQVVSKNQESSTREMQSIDLHSLPFQDKQMAFFFVMLLGADQYGGASVGECYYAADRIQDGDTESFIQAFAGIAQHAEEQGHQFLSAGHRTSAREAFLRATNYYFGADHYTDSDHPKYQEFWQKSVTCFQQACKLSNPPIEILHIPFQGKNLPGYFIHAQGHPRGTILAMSGFDGSAEWLYFSLGTGLAARGYNILQFEGPGHRGVSHLHNDLPFPPDYELPVKAVIDFALARADVDPEHLGLFGHSFGGHLVLRPAAFDPRIKALIADSPVSDFGAMMLRAYPPEMLTLPAPVLDRMSAEMMGTLPPTLQASSKRLYEALRVRTASEFVKRMSAFKFDEISRIECPVLCLVSEAEGVSAIQETERFYRSISNPAKAMRVFTALDGADAHVQLNNFQLSVEVISDWLDDLWAK